MKIKLILLVAVTASLGYLFYRTINNPPTESENNKGSENIQQSVPLPTGEDAIRLFFSLINENKVEEALNMLSEEIAESEDSKQSWGVQFNDILSAEVVDVKPYNTDIWTDTAQTYEVTVKTTVHERAAKYPIPYYGWENGENTRWVTIKNDGVQWKIAGIATGP